jgi:hypothetical protein
MVTSGHVCPNEECNSTMVCNIKFSKNVNGTFFNLYRCLKCGKEFENPPSHKEIQTIER